MNCAPTKIQGMHSGCRGVIYHARGIHRMKIFSRIAPALLLFLCFAHPAQAKKIYIAISNPDMSFLSGGVAQVQGYFRDEGLDVELVQITANVSVAALAAGNIDYNLILQSIVTGNLRGLPMKVAAILIERPNHVFVVDKSIQKFADLKGKKVAISSYGSLT